eukprot:Skav215903  [mRNA]  locus=scaffold1542:134066:141383:- [translate_table: standard]
MALPRESRDRSKLAAFGPAVLHLRQQKCPDAQALGASGAEGSGFAVLAVGFLGLHYAFVGSSTSLRGNRVALEAERQFIVGGNWKANGSPESVQKLIEATKRRLREGARVVHGELNEGEDVEVICAPPFVYLSEVQGKLRKDYSVAAQNLWDKDPGETPAQMLADMGIKWVILGHSERRENCGETSQIGAEKTKFAVDNGLSTLTCIGTLVGARPAGEKLDAREALSGKTFDVLDEQLKPLADVLTEALGAAARAGRIYHSTAH